MASIEYESSLKTKQRGYYSRSFGSRTPTRRCATGAAWLAFGLFLLAFAPLAGAEGAGADKAEKSAKDVKGSDFALDGPHLLKAGSRSQCLLAADLNSDGRADLATAANEKSIIEIYLQQEAENGLPAFKKTEAAVDQYVQAMAALDADGDGRTDLVLAGSPARLSWMRQGEDGVLSAPRALEIEAEELAAGDWSGDGIPDLVCVAGKKIVCIPAGLKGLDWAAARTVWSVYDLAGAPEILDLNGDGLLDLAFAESQRNDRILVRFQSPEGSFPDEAVLDTPALDNWGALAKTSERPSILAILSKTQGLEALAWPREQEEAKPSAAPESRGAGRFRTVAFDPESRSERLTAAMIPLAGGGVPCALLAGVGSPTIRLLRAGRDGSLSFRTLPSLTGVTQLLPWPPTGKKDSWRVGLLSPSEKTLAFCRLDAQGESLTFPQAIALKTPPLAAVLAPLSSPFSWDLAIVRPSGEAASPNSLILEIRLNLAFDSNDQLRANGATTTFTLQAQLGDGPSGLLAMDLNHDGRPDLAALFQYIDPIILLQSDSGWAPLAAGEGMLQGLLSGTRAGAVSTAALGPNGEESLLIAKENYARAVRLGADGQTIVDGQFNGKNARSRIRGAIAARLDEKGAPSMVLLDSANRCLTLYRRGKDNANYELSRNIELDDADYQQVLAADLNEDRREDLLLLAPDRLTVFYPGMPEGRLESIAKAKTNVADGAYGAAAALNILNNGEQQILAVERTENVIEFFHARAQAGEFQRFYRFKMFETDSPRGRREAAQGPIQPREIEAADLNGDKKQDLILLMHDVIGIYYQK